MNLFAVKFVVLLGDDSFDRLFVNEKNEAEATWLLRVWIYFDDDILDLAEVGEVGF